MKNQTLYCMYVVIFVGMSSINSTSQAGFFDALTNFLNSFTHQNTQNNYTLTITQAQNYIDLSLASLNTGLRPNASDYDIQAIRNKTYGAFNQSSTVYAWIQGTKMYSRDMIDQIILSAIIEVVESNTYNYAYDQTRNSTVASKVTQTIRTRLMRIMEKTAVINEQEIRQFFGYSLQQMVRHEITYGMQGHGTYGYSGTTGSTGSTGFSGRTGSTGSTGSGARHHNHPTYPSESCCVCFDDFDGVTTERLFLKPCGHDICLTCALDYFFPHNKADTTKKCPICSSWVNLEEII
jgi:hypothetical protein